MIWTLCWVLSAFPPEGLYHKWDGIPGCSPIQCPIAFPWELSGYCSHGNSPKHGNFLLFSESIHVKVAASDGLTGFFPSPPGSSFVVMCSGHNCSFTGCCCSSEISHELISLGSSDISECFGICLGKWKHKLEESLLSFLCLSCERASTTLFCFCADHWLCLLAFASIHNWAVLWMCVPWTMYVSIIICARWSLVHTLLLRHNREYFVKYQSILLAIPTDGLKYGECQLEDIWRWVCRSQAHGHDSCKTHYIEKSKIPALLCTWTRESRIFESRLLEF